MQAFEGRQIAGDTDNAFSLSTEINGDYEAGRFAAIADLIYANGAGDTPDGFGVVLMPSLMLTDSLELVARYHGAHADGNEGLTLRRRYARRVPGAPEIGLGDRFHSAYLGLNYYLHDHKLKLMAGVDYAAMDGFEDGGNYKGWTWYLGSRLYF